MKCSNCDIESGLHVLCNGCRKGWKSFPASRKKKIRIRWHKIVCEPYRIGFSDWFECFHCGGQFPENEIIGDHFPDPKSVDPENEFNVEKAVGSCSPCNCNMNGKRRESLQKIASGDYLYVMQESGKHVLIRANGTSIKIVAH